MPLAKKDFIEIEFTAKIKETGEVFDSNIKEELKKAGSKIPAKPLIYCLDEGMFLEGINNYLIGKEIGDYKIELKPENAFGKRDSQLVQRIPMKVFIQHKIRPIQGGIFDFDGKSGKVVSISGGRVLVDFNHPLAGKEVIYEIKVKRKIEDLHEKIKAFNEFIFRKEFKFEIQGKKVIYELNSENKNLKSFLELFKEKFKKIFELELEVKEDCKRENRRKNYKN